MRPGCGGVASSCGCWRRAAPRHGASGYGRRDSRQSATGRPAELGGVAEELTDSDRRADALNRRAAALLAEKPDVAFDRHGDAREGVRPRGCRARFPGVPRTSRRWPGRCAGVWLSSGGPPGGAFAIGVDDRAAAGSPTRPSCRSPGRQAGTGASRSILVTTKVSPSRQAANASHSPGRSRLQPVRP
jgi:hypothetical protein